MATAAAGAAPGTAVLTMLCILCAASRAAPDACEGVWSRRVLFKVWGAGGGTYLDNGSGQYGGAGGFIRGTYCWDQFKELTLVVGGAGDGNQQPGFTYTGLGVCANGGAPNGGCAEVAAGGGGSSHVLFGSADMVLLGAGGGGGCAHHGGGGGGGTCNGVVGQGGHGQGNTAAGTAGRDGGGGAGATSSGSCGAGGGRGAGQQGGNSNGAGGDGSNNYGGGGGGAASCRFATDCEQEDATDGNAVALSQLPAPYRTMHKPGAKDTAGAIVVQDAATGAVLAAHFEPGTYTFAANMSELMDAHLQLHLRAYHECTLAGGNYTVSTAACVLRGDTQRDPPRGGACANHSAGFVGLGADGSLVVCPPSGHATVHIGGTVQTAELDRLRAENSFLMARLLQLEERVGYATCAERWRAGGSAFNGEGVYQLRTAAGQGFAAYCDADGWTLIRNQVDPGVFFLFTSEPKALGSRTDAGVQLHLEHIVSAATVMRYTDANGTVMLEAEFDGDLYWRRVSGSLPCGLVPVRYTKGPLAGVDRKIVASPDAYWFHPRVQGCGSAFCATAEASVENVFPNSYTCVDIAVSAYRHRPFYGPVCDGQGVAFCPGYEPAYNFPANAGPVTGGFLYQQWVF